MAVGLRLPASCDRFKTFSWDPVRPAEWPAWGRYGTDPRLRLLPVGSPENTTAKLIA